MSADQEPNPPSSTTAAPDSSFMGSFSYTVRSPWFPREWENCEFRCEDEIKSKGDGSIWLKNPSNSLGGGGLGSENFTVTLGKPV